MMPNVTDSNIDSINDYMLHSTIVTILRLVLRPLRYVPSSLTRLKCSNLLYLLFHRKNHISCSEQIRVPTCTCTRICQMVRLRPHSRIALVQVQVPGTVTWFLYLYTYSYRFSIVRSTFSFRPKEIQVFRGSKSFHFV